MYLKGITKNDLLRNTFFLYLLRFSSVIFTAITLPIQARILGVSIFGELGIINAIMTYFTLFIDFGFTLSATAEISKNKSNLYEVRKIFSAVIIIKFIISLFSFCFLFIYLLIVDNTEVNASIYYYSLLAVLVNGFLPDFVYRGMEVMGAFTFRTILVRLLFTLSIVFFLKTESDIAVIPLSNLFGNIIALIWAIIDMKLRFGFFKLIKVNIYFVYNTLLESFQYFLSRIVSVIYSTANTLILSQIDKSLYLVGLFSASFRVAQLVHSGFAPIADSFYPYMIRTKNISLVMKIIRLYFVIMIPLVIVFVFFAKDIISIIFGKEYVDASISMIALIPNMVLMFPNYLLGFPSLSSINKQKWANFSIYISFVLFVLIIIMLFVFNKISIVSLSIAYSFTTIIEVLIRYTIVRINISDYEVE